MRKLMVMLGLFGLCASAFATGPSCVDQAQEKKLAGAAKNSFMKKCEADTQAACEASALDKKLAGAAKISFIKKCVKDGVGNAAQ